MERGPSLRARRAAIRRRACLATGCALGLLVAQAAAGADRIGAAELARQPLLVVAWSLPEVPRGACHTGVVVARPDGSLIRTLRRWAPFAFGIGKARRRMTDVVPEDVRWSPDRSSISVAMTGWYQDPFSWAVIVSADGTRSRRLTPIGFDGPWSAPSWSPDGATVAYMRDDRLRVRRVSPTLARETEVRGAAGRWRRSPDWSPDGLSFAAVGTGIVVTSRDGRNPRRLTSNPSDASPSWAPDGRTIAFARSGILVIPAAGGRARRLTTGRDTSPRWSPDGRLLLFVRQEWDETRKPPFRSWRRLWVMDADGGRQAPLALNRRTGACGGIVAADWGR